MPPLDPNITIGELKTIIFIQCMFVTIITQALVNAKKKHFHNNLLL
jgi:hypothetical protein